MFDDCIFCKIAGKEIPSKIEYEDDEIVAFDDINPKAPIHILIIPKKHIGSITAMDEKDIAIIPKMITAAKNIAKSKGISDFRLVFNSGPDAGMEIDHLHLHLLGGAKLGPMA
jgi:histidine triad (HIT) family protein